MTQATLQGRVALVPGAGRGIGRALVKETERLIRAAGGTRVYIETSYRPQYAATRAFYERCGYHLASVVEDFYAPGDAKATYCKVLQQAPARPNERGHPPQEGARP